MEQHVEGVTHKHTLQEEETAVVLKCRPEKTHSSEYNVFDIQASLYNGVCKWTCGWLVVGAQMLAVSLYVPRHTSACHQPLWCYRYHISMSVTHTHTHLRLCGYWWGVSSETEKSWESIRVETARLSSNGSQCGLWAARRPSLCYTLEDDLLIG